MSSQRRHAYFQLTYQTTTTFLADEGFRTGRDADIRGLSVNPEFCNSRARLTNEGAETVSSFTDKGSAAMLGTVVTSSVGYTHP